MFNYRGKLKNEFAEQLVSDHDGTVRARYVDDLADYERGVKRARLQTQQKTTTASVVKHGNFWPKETFKLLWGDNESVEGCVENTVLALAVRRRPEGERWNKEMILEIKGTPAKPNPTSEGI